MERIAALVPPPRRNLVRYHGVLAPNACMQQLFPRFGFRERAPCRLFWGVCGRGKGGYPAYPQADRPCKGGAPTQNSHAVLLNVLGPRPAQKPDSQDNRLTGKGSQKISAAPAHVAEDGHLHSHD